MKRTSILLVLIAIGMLLPTFVYSQVNQNNTNCNFCSDKKCKSKGDIIQSSKINIINPFGPDKIITKVQYGDRVKFKILSVNTFKVNGLLVSNPVNIDFEVPPVFSESMQPAIKIEKPGDKSRSNPTDIDRIEQTTNTIAPDIEEKKEKFKTEFAQFRKTYGELVLCSKLEDHLKTLISDEIFIRDTVNLREKCQSQYKICYGQNTDISDAKNKITEQLAEIDRSFTSLKVLYEELQDMQKPDPMIMEGTLQTADKNNSITIKNATVKLTKKKYFEDEFSYAKKIADQLNDANYRTTLIDKVYAGIFLYDRIQREHFEIYTESEPILSDEVSITPVLKYFDGKIAKEFVPFHFRTSGGLKVNFSSGYLLSFRGDDNFMSCTNSTGNTLVLKGNANGLTHALGALAHVYCRSHKDYNIALSSGISMSNNSSLGFYLGVSGLFSEQRRMCITIGISSFQLQQLNTSNLIEVEDKQYKFKNDTDIEIRYDNVYKFAPFVGITYNLSRSN